MRPIQTYLCQLQHVLQQSIDDTPMPLHKQENKEELYHLQPTSNQPNDLLRLDIDDGSQTQWIPVLI